MTSLPAFSLVSCSVWASPLEISHPVLVRVLQLGNRNERIMNTRQVLYEAPPNNVIITTNLIELETSTGNPMDVPNKTV